MMGDDDDRVRPDLSGTPLERGAVNNSARLQVAADEKEFRATGRRDPKRGGSVLAADHLPEGFVPV